MQDELLDTKQKLRRHERCRAGRRTVPYYKQDCLCETPMTEEPQNSPTHEDRIIGTEEQSVTPTEAIHLRAVLAAAQEYITAVKEQQKGGVGRAWAQLVKAVHACEEKSPD
jgi:hypothetical protein